MNVRVTQKMIAIKEELSQLQININKVDYLHITGKCVFPASV